MTSELRRKQPVSRSLVISVPEPRALDLIFTPAQKARLFDAYEIIEVEAGDFDALPGEVLRQALYIIGQPAIPASCPA